MKSSNDIYHGDEHITDKPLTFVVNCSEVVTYQIEVEAMDEEEASDLAQALLSKDSKGNYIVDQSGFQTDLVKVVREPQNYNYSYGGTDD
jgi:hypothetical protein